MGTETMKPQAGTSSSTMTSAQLYPPTWHQKHVNTHNML